MKTPLIFSIIAFAVLTACAKPTPSTLDSAKDDERYLKAKAAYKPNLGKNFWARLDVNLCPRPSLLGAGLFWLVLTVAMTGLFWVPYILDRIMVRGLMAAMANPSPTDKAQSPWARRLMAAHVNAVENLVIFAPLVFDGAGAEQHDDSYRFRVRALFLVTACACRGL